jgi:peroxiredoxin
VFARLGREVAPKWGNGRLSRNFSAKCQVRGWESTNNPDHRETLVRTLILVATLFCCVCVLAEDKKPAPALTDVTDWIGTEPIKLSDWKGDVVIVHFWTHGCFNCVNNYPHYRAWTTDFKNKDVKMLGIHTPEFDTEKKKDAIEAAMKKNKLTFPVAVDNKSANWKAWGNRYWPCVYLIDRAGQVRHRWEGELGKDGEAKIRKAIEELLAEKK